jgi:hypothetical protein
MKTPFKIKAKLSDELEFYSHRQISEIYEPQVNVYIREYQALTWFLAK